MSEPRLRPRDVAPLFWDIALVDAVCAPVLWLSGQPEAAAIAVVGAVLLPACCLNVWRRHRRSLESEAGKR